MQNALKSALKPLGIRVVKPPHSALAVLSGAVLFGLNPRNMHVRIAKHTYAESVLNQYDAGIHAGRPVITVIQNGQPVQRVCVLKTFVSRGDELPVGFAVTIHGTPAHDGQTAVVSELYR